MIKIKRIYSAVEESDGYRVLVDRLWPRGVTRKKAKLNDWLKDISPSNELRKWFYQKPRQWDEFVARYQTELQLPLQADNIERLQGILANRTVTLLYVARDEHLNHAAILKDHLTRQY